MAAAVLVSVRDGKVGFRSVGAVAAGAEVSGLLPEPTGTPAGVSEVLVEALTGTGLYPAEAKAMVRTWERSWFREEGDRVLYLVPRSRTDELLPMRIEPEPAEVARVLVARHDFLTSEREAALDRQIERERAGRTEPIPVGRFAPQARRLAEKRLDGEPAARR